MKRSIFFLVALFYVAAIILADYLSAAELTRQDLHTYYRSLRHALTYQQYRVQSKLEAINQRNVDATDEMKTELTQATQMLDLKMALMQTFDNPANLQSPHVREILLTLMQKESIDGQDLIQFGNTIRNENQLIRKAVAEK
jgi:hypothetical protein